MHLTPHPLVTLFRIRVTFLTTLFRREITPLRTAASFSLALLRKITPHPTHWDAPRFSLLLHPTINTPRRCGSSGHPTRVFAALNRPPPCHSKALPLRPPPRVPCAHPSAPLTPSPPDQCALTAHITLRAFSRAHPSAFSHFLTGPILAVCRIHIYCSSSATFSSKCSSLPSTALSPSESELASQPPTRMSSASRSLKPTSFARQAPASRQPGDACHMGRLTKMTDLDATSAAAAEESVQLCARDSTAVTCAVLQQKRSHPASSSPRPSRGDLCAGSSGTLFKCRRCILNGATLRACAEPLQLRSLSKRRRYVLNAKLMLRTFGRTRYALKVAFRLNVHAVSPQSRPRCMVDQPTCETVSASSPRALSVRNRCFHSFPPSSPLASRAKSVGPVRSCPPTDAALPESKTWVCTEFASLVSSQQIAPR